MAVVTMRQLLESGVHFGHQTRRWNPKMKRFIMTERNGIYIIDLQQSLAYIDRAYAFIKETVAKGGTVMFVGTKKQAQEAIAEQATRVGMPYVNQRWLGGMLTNFQTVHQRINRLKELDEIDFDDVAGSGRTKKELLQMQARARQARQDPRRHPRDGPHARRRLDRRHQEGAPRRRGGPQAADPDHRHPRHQLRPRRGRLPDPGQRRRDPRRRPAHPRGRRRRRRGPDRPLRRQAGEGAGDEPAPRSRWPSGSASCSAATPTQAAVAATGWRRRAAEAAAGRRGRPVAAAEAPPRPPPRPSPRRPPPRRLRSPRLRPRPRSPRRLPSRRAEAPAAEEAPAEEAAEPAAEAPGRGRRAAEAAAEADAAEAEAPRRGRPSRARQPLLAATTESIRGRAPMANFTAADVKKLRELTGAGMMDCKKALERGRRRLRQGRRDPPRQGPAKAPSAAPSARPRAGLVAHAPAAPWSSSTARPTSSPRATSSSPPPQRDRRRGRRRPRPADAEALKAVPLGDKTVGEVVEDLADHHRREDRARPGRRTSTARS